MVQLDLGGSMGEPKAGVTTRATIAEAIRGQKPGWMKRDAAAFLETFIEELSDGLERDGVVTILNFGTWRVKAKAERKGARNFQTGERLIVGPHRVVTFKPAEKLLKAVAARAGTRLVSARELAEQSEAQ